MNPDIDVQMLAGGKERRDKGSCAGKRVVLYQEDQEGNPFSEPQSTLI